MYDCMFIRSGCYYEFLARKEDTGREGQDVSQGHEPITPGKAKLGRVPSTEIYER